MPEDRRPQPDADDAARRQRLDAMREVARQRLGMGMDAPTTPAPPQAGREGSADGGWMRRRPALVMVAVLVVAGLIAGGVAGVARLTSHGPSAPTPTTRGAGSGVVRSFRDFALPTPDAKPFDIARGPDGALWFTEFDGNKIGRITPEGAVTEYPVPTPGVAPYLLATSADGALWFTEYYGNKIGRVTTSGTVTEFPLPDPTSSATGITAGSDGAIWVAAYPAEIDRIAPDGVMTRFNLPSPSPVPFALAAGADGALWFTYDTEFTSADPADVNRIGRISPSGAISEYALPTTASNVDDIAAGPDGKLWFTDFANDLIGSISSSGAVHEYPARSPYTALNAIASGPDGALWFTRQDGVIGRITPDGAISTFTVPTLNSQPDGIAAGSGQTLWIAETGANRIGCLTIG